MLLSNSPAFTTRKFGVSFLAVFVLLGLAFLHHHGNLAAISIAPITAWSKAASPSNITQEFSWDLLTPAKELNWQECFPGRQCARLVVPLDYSDPQGAEATIALIRKPSTVAESSSEYKGPVLFNPGGPGGSGVRLIREMGDAFSVILGPQFDVVGFDPRGIGQSTPRVAMFGTVAERALWVASDLHNPEDDVANTWARALIQGKLAEDRDDGHLRHINTDQTARDMLHIVKAHGRTKLRYWGFSYGSVLGAVFASMFPDSVERLVIDGVVDSENYFATLWSNNLLDTDKTMESFYTECADAGPDRCAFWAPSPDDIRQNLTNLYESIRVKPIPVKIGNTYGYVDYKMLHTAVFQALYFPFALFRLLAQGLAELAAGDGTKALETMTLPAFECSADSSEALKQNIAEAEAAIACNDGVDVPADLESAQRHFEIMSKASEFGKQWAPIRIACAGWPKFPKNHFQGPFEANTSHPLLLIGNTADPVTPLWAANKMSRGFTNSIVLTQNSSGHCSISAPSVCTAKYVRQYFADGTLPKPGTVCEPDLGPFDSVEQGSPEEAQQRLSMDMNEQDKLLMSAMQELSHWPFTSFRPPFGALRFGS